MFALCSPILSAVAEGIVCRTWWNRRHYECWSRSVRECCSLFFRYK